MLGKHQLSTSQQWEWGKLAINAPERMSNLMAIHKVTNTWQMKEEHATEARNHADN